MRRTYIIAAVFIVVVIGLAFGVRTILLGGTSVDTPSDNSLHDAVAQKMAGTQLGESGDFSIEDAHYFEDKQWAVATVKPKQANAAETDIAIFQKTDDSYQVVMGPGSVFPEDTIQYLPSSVLNYLRSINAIGGSTTNQ